MEFEKLEKVHQGRFISRYDITYRTPSGREKVYEMISRDPDLKEQADLWRRPVHAVALIITDESGERLLLNREYRLGVAECVYNFPAGLIEPGEDLEAAARRELREETGLTLTRVVDVLPASYSAPGFGNEKNAHLVGVAAGELRPSDREEEEIRAAWFTRAQLRELLRREHFAARTQVYCYAWSREDGADPISACGSDKK
ncbi:MAG: NUDIX hydrolase [Firmicutes bacterium]|nr:NUDIX hydrolase [Bacillota bacterium]